MKKTTFEEIARALGVSIGEVNEKIINFSVTQEGGGKISEGQAERFLAFLTKSKEEVAVRKIVQTQVPLDDHETAEKIWGTGKVAPSLW